MIKVLQLFLFFFFSSAIFLGQEIAISEIVIDGNKTTKEAIILRELPFSIGETIDNTKLDALVAFGGAEP